RLDARLRSVGAVSVGAATEGSRAKRTAAITIFRVPVVGAGSGVGVFNLIHHTGVPGAFRDQHVMRRNSGVSLAVAEEDHVAMAQHDVVGAGSTVDRLMEVIAHRV